MIDSTGTLRYLGQFRDRRHAFAHEALKAVLAGTEIAIKAEVVLPRPLFPPAVLDPPPTIAGRETNFPKPPSAM